MPRFASRFFRSTGFSRARLKGWGTPDCQWAARPVKAEEPERGHAARSPESEHPVVLNLPPQGRACARPFIAKMKSSEKSAATLVSGLFNTRVLRAAAILPVFGAGTLLAAEPAPVSDATVTASHPAAAPAPVSPVAKTSGPADDAKPGSATPAPAPVAGPAKPVAVADEKAPVNIGKTVVVAARREQSLSDVSPSVSVISGDEIRTMQFNTLGEVLATQPGVFVSGGDLSLGQHESVFTRGTNSNMTSVLLDGRRLSPGLDGSSEIERYSTGGLESVQFARGPNSTLYGGNAIGGVIDMRTVDPLKLANPTGFAGVEAGSFGTVRGSAGVSGATSTSSGDGVRKDVGATVSGDWTTSQGPIENSAYNGNHALGRVDFSPVNGVTFDTLAQVHDFGIGVPGSISAPSAVNHQWDRGWLVSPGATFSNDDDFKARLFYSRTDSETVNHIVSTGPYDSDSVVTMDEVSLQADWTAAKWALLSAGYNYDKSDLSQVSDFGFGPSAQQIIWESHSIWGRVVLTSYDKTTELGVGGRRQWFDDFSDASTGEVFGSQAFTETGTKLFAKAATSYATPTAQDYFYNTPIGVLKPEEVSSWEVGVKQKFFEKTSPLEISATYFENDMTNLISFVTTGPFTDSSFNVGKSEARGVELALDWLPVKQLRFYANGTIQDARVTKDSPAGTPSYAQVMAGDKLARRPDYTTTFGVEVYPVDTVTLGISGTGVMGREDTGHVDMGDYFVARAYGSWRFTRNFEVFGRVENIFDANYDASAVGYQGLPLAAYAGIRAGF